MLKQNDFNKHQEIIDKSSYFMSDGELDRERLNIVNEIYNSKTFGFLIKHGLKAGTHVLEIGCGYGHCAIWMAQQVAKNGGSVTAIDFSEETLDIAKQNAINAGVFNIEFICFDISLISNLKTKVPIDFVYGRWVIEFCKLSPDKVLQDLYTLLSPGGIFTYETGNFINNGIRGEPENILINRWQALCLA
ncbi:MAG: Ubiquinone/menaquinone biosynthesis methyltransferase UbiE, partial [Burkholderiales bacterium]|nr:Ubiquinone/menaquinone biosynthesis methyltransferase UbiE [Burkholderiales bacterium]